MSKSNHNQTGLMIVLKPAVREIGGPLMSVTRHMEGPTNPHFLIKSRRYVDMLPKGPKPLCLGETGGNTREDMVGGWWASRRAVGRQESWL